MKIGTGLIALTLTALWVIATYLFVVHPASTHLMDFSLFFESGERVARCESIYATPYTVVAHNNETFTLQYFYPPFLAIALSYLTPLGIEALKVWWLLVSLVALLLSALGLASIISRNAKLDKPLILSLGSSFFLICFEPVYWGIRLGQVDPIILALMVGFVSFGERNRDLLSGACLALAASIKMSPLLLILAPLCLKKWRLLLSVAAWLILISTTLALAPLQTYQMFFTNFFNVASGDTNREFITNYALTRAALVPLGLSPSGLLGWAIRIGVLTAALLLVTTNRRLGWLKVNAILVCFMLLAAPTVYFQHLMWTLIPIAILVSSFVSQSTNPQRAAFFLLLLFFAIDQINLVHYKALKWYRPAADLTALAPSLLIFALILTLIRAHSTTKA